MLYFSGIFLAIITDYMPHRYSDKALIRITVSFILNLFTGGLGTMLNFNFLFKLMSKNEHDCFTICFGYIILSAIFEYGGIVCFAGQNAGDLRLVHFAHGKKRVRDAASVARFRLFAARKQGFHFLLPECDRARRKETVFP